MASLSGALGPSEDFRGLSGATCADRSADSQNPRPELEGLLYYHESMEEGPREVPWATLPARLQTEGWGISSGLHQSTGASQRWLACPSEKGWIKGPDSLEQCPAEPSPHHPEGDWLLLGDYLYERTGDPEGEGS